MPDVAGAGRARRARVRRGAVCPRAGASRHYGRLDRLPVQTLRDALASGQAMYGNGAIADLSPRPSAALRKLRTRVDVICRDVPRVVTGTSGVIHTATGMAFTELTVGGSGYMVGCGRRQAASLAPGRPLDIVTGTCLFGADALAGAAGERAYPLAHPRVVSGYAGSPFDAVLVDERLHVYEAENVARLSSFIRELAGQMAPSPVRVHAHIPVPEYEAYGLSLYARGYLTRAQCDHYRDAVRRRGRLVSAMLIASLPGMAGVSVGSPMSWLSDIDPYSVPRDELGPLLHRAAQGQDQLWRVLAKATDGQSFQALNQASYIYQYLSAARSVQRRGSQLAAVEDPDEIFIYHHAMVRQQPTGISLSGCVRFYVHPRLVVHETAFGLAERLLYNCKDGCNPRCVRLATEQTLTVPRGSGVGGEPDRARAEVHSRPDPHPAAQFVAGRDPRPVADHHAVQHRSLADAHVAADRAVPDGRARAHSHAVEQHAALDLGARVHMTARADGGTAGQLGPRLHDRAGQHQGLAARPRHRRRDQLAEHQVT